MAWGRTTAHPVRVTADDPQRLLGTPCMHYGPFIRRNAATMDTPLRSGEGPAPTAPASLAIQTTLYELIAALSAAVRPDEGNAVTATVVHLLQTH